MQMTENVVASILLAGVLVFQSTFVKGQGTSKTDLKSMEAIRPFRVHIPDAALNDLHKRILATRWPDKETVADASQGAKLSRLQGLVDYWGRAYDWRKAETKLNAWPQFVSNIDGV